MIGNKEEHFEGKGTDLGALVSHIESYLQKDGFTVQTASSNDQSRVIQAKKGGFLRDVIDADRALTITITGDPNDFKVQVGIGKWLEHLAIALAETVLISELFLLVDVAESAWNVEIENKLIADLKSFIG